MRHVTRSAARRSFVAALVAIVLLALGTPSAIHAQGAYSLATVPTGNTSTSSNSFISFDITAHQAVRLYRFWNLFSGTGSTLVDIWAHPNGYVNQNTGWIHLGRTTVTVTQTSTPTEIPINLDFLIQPNEKWGFIISNHTISVKYNSSITQSSFTDSYMTIDCGSHCAGTGTGDPTTGTTSFSFSLCPRQISGIVYYDEGATAPNDAGISSIDSPLNFCAGVHDVSVSMQNFGINQITSATINWKLNGVPQSPYSWTGLLDTLNAASRKTSVTLASMNFLPGIPYTIEAWTSMPNGVADTVNNNDTTIVTRQSALSGTFTIGGSNPDFADFDAALTVLHDNGLCGPVVFNVRPGTYNEQVAIGGGRGTVTGTSSVNTVTFQSETGNRADVTVNFYSQTGNPTLYINSTDWLIFRNMTFTATNPSYAIVFYYLGGSDNCTFENIDFISMPVLTTSTNNTVIYSPSGSIDNNNSFINCNIVNGSYGMYIYGSGSTATEDNTLIQNCRFTGQYYRPVYAYYLGQTKFLDNTVIQEANNTYTYHYPVAFYYGYNSQIERNTIISYGGTYCYGVYFYYENYYQSGSSRFVNNMVTLLDCPQVYYGMYAYRMSNTLFAHNTFYTNTPYASSYLVYAPYADGSEIYNNILYHAGAGYCWYEVGTGYVSASDYNLWYSNGSSLAYWGGARADLAALQAYTGMDAHSITKSVTFKDVYNGDLHLASPSDDDTDMFGLLLPSVTDDIDHEARVQPYKGADEACYITPGSVNYDFVDANGYPAAYAEAPGSIGLHYSVAFPEFDATITMSVRFYTVPGDQLVYTATLNAQKQYGVTLDGVQYITLPSSLQPGTYKIEVNFWTKNSCDAYRNYMPYPSALLVVGEGQQPCVVWPGDVNNDGIVNYTDRRGLNMYIYNANLRTTWLSGPARYQADSETNPFTYLEWKPQAAAPWYTPEGCYMDTDGNGVVNNLDYIAMKLNWVQTTPYYTGTPKAVTAVAAGFSMDQNYPNPFNPTTMIRFAVPEQSHVRLVVTDALGRQVAELVDGKIEQGLHEVQFDGAQLASGTYIATVTMTGVESGMSYTKNIKMALNK
ncbi:hypothetical protein KQI65_11280 [bacterium]|nr:hypothetical protein [bacterium]